MREKNFHEFCSFVAICKSFLCKIWGMAFFGAAKASNLRKFSPRKSYFSPIHGSFLPQKFSAIWYKLSSNVCLSVCLSVFVCFCLFLFVCIHTHNLINSLIPRPSLALVFDCLQTLHKPQLHTASNQKLEPERSGNEASHFLRIKLWIASID